MTGWSTTADMLYPVIKEISDDWKALCDGYKANPQTVTAQQFVEGVVDYADTVQLLFLEKFMEIGKSIVKLLT